MRKRLRKDEISAQSAPEGPDVGLLLGEYTMQQ